MWWSNQYGWSDCRKLWFLPHYEITSSAIHRSSTPGPSQGIWGKKVGWGGRAVGNDSMELKSIQPSQLLHNLFRSHWGIRASRAILREGERVRAQGFVSCPIIHPDSVLWASKHGGHGQALCWAPTFLGAHIHILHVSLKQPIFKVSVLGWALSRSWTLWGEMVLSYPPHVSCMTLRDLLSFSECLTRRMRRNASSQSSERTGNRREITCMNTSLHQHTPLTLNPYDNSEISIQLVVKVSIEDVVHHQAFLTSIPVLFCYLIVLSKC